MCLITFLHQSGYEDSKNPKSIGEGQKHTYQNDWAHCIEEDNWSNYELEPLVRIVISFNTNSLGEKYLQGDFPKGYETEDGTNSWNDTWNEKTELEYNVSLKSSKRLVLVAFCFGVSCVTCSNVLKHNSSFEGFLCSNSF